MTRNLGASLLLAMLVAPVAADPIVVPVIPGGSLSAGQLHSLQSRQQRLDFQQRQQFNREIDSLSNQQRQQRPQVPVMKPRCPFQTSGTPRTC